MITICQEYLSVPDPGELQSTIEKYLGKIEKGYKMSVKEALHGLGAGDKINSKSRQKERRRENRSRRRRRDRDDEAYSAVYDVGVRFWYWDKATKPKQACLVTKKYENLKEEMTAASVAHLTVESFDALREGKCTLNGYEVFRKMRDSQRFPKNAENVFLKMFFLRSCK